MMRSRWLQAVRHYAESLTQAAHAISTKQQLYVTDPITPGLVFFLPHGTRVMNKLVQFMKHQQTRHGFQEVITPLIYKTKLWEKLGHWENYKEDMFKVVGEAHRDDDMHEYGLKPMNCPGHCVIFDKFDRLYNELPVRLSDFSSLHRNEALGALSGLTRVRRFHQDDGHIFCELGHIELEIQNTLRLIQQTYAVFGIDQVEYYLLTRPTKFMGDIATWNEAEAQLARVLDAQGRPWQERPEDGAFYGPKIDVLVTDAFGKKHQVGTVQLDFQLPQRFDLKYVGSDNGLHRPIMVHRAVFGSLERFFAILLDHYQGKWPFWINPRQAVILPVNDTHVEAAKKLQHQLSGDIAEGDPELAPITGHEFYVDVDSRSETIGTRIKDAVQKGYSYIMLLGDKDLANGTVAIRTRDSRKVENKTPEDIYELFRSLEATYK